MRRPTLNLHCCFVQLAREQAELASAKRSHSEPGSTSLSHIAASSSDLAVSTPVTASMSPTIPAHSSSPIPAGLAVPVTRPPPAASVTPKSAATSDSEATAMYHFSWQVLFDDYTSYHVSEYISYALLTRKMDNLPSQGAYESNDGAPAPNNEA